MTGPRPDFGLVPPRHHPLEATAVRKAQPPWGDVAERIGTDVLVDLREPAGSPRTGLLAARRWERAAKRSVDLVGAAIALAVLTPVFLIVGSAIKVSSPGPIFFIQERVGQKGRPFRMVKFRSMYADAHRRRQELAELNESRGPVFKIRSDPRVTPLGRVLRKLSIDELPQLLNVVAGHMSLVGPRPPLPEEVVLYSPRELGRLAVKPGITCLWQVMGRADLDFDTWVDLDLRYIETWNLWLDCKLLALTLPAVLSGRGAY
jgi:lipopolysaccharide/colanic/teichoic acid biosynthesis glycosyltransferase